MGARKKESAEFILRLSIERKKREKTLAAVGCKDKFFLQFLSFPFTLKIFQV
jgi:hypothetical protein